MRDLTIIFLHRAKIFQLLPPFFRAVKNQYGQYEMPAGYTTMSADANKYSNLGNRLLGVSVAEERASEFDKQYKEFLQLLADAESGKAQIDTAVDNLAQEQYDVWQYKRAGQDG